MEIDQVNRNNQKERKRKPLTDQQKKWFAEKACIKCGQQGHWANKCEAKTVAAVRKTMDDTAGKQASHAMKHWTCCYDDDCRVHLSSKENSGWMPRRSKARGKEEREHREYQYHRSLHGRRCHVPNCDVPGHRMWKEEQELEKEIEHESLTPEECTETHCHFHQNTNQVAQVTGQTGESIVPYLEVEAIINGHSITAFVDSGSHGNFIDPGTVKDLGLQWIHKTEPYRVTGADGTALNQTGRITTETAPVTYYLQNKMFVETFDIMPMGSHLLMFGMPWLRKHNPYVDWTKGTITFGLTTPTYGTAVMQVQIQGIPKQYQDLAEAFKELEGPDALPDHQEWDLTIPLQEGTKPHNETLRRTDGDRAKQIREFLDDRLAKGWIEESQSPVGYNMLFVPKKGEGEERACIDYRKLNDITIKDSHPLPLISEIQDRLAKATIFTKLDIKDAYHQVRIKAGEEWKTAFKTRYGTFQWKVMPFGLTNAPACFQRLINTALKGYIDVFCTAYLDDIIIFSEDEEEHVEHVRKVVQRLIQWKLRLKLKKCEFGVQETGFLGHILRPGEIAIEQGKIDSIVNWPTPQSVKDVQSFLGLGNYYRKFIQGYSKIAKPLTDLGRNGQIFK